MPADISVAADGIVLVPDSMAWGYPQTDGEGSGATDENVMYREVLPERDTLKLNFDMPDEVTGQKIMQARGKVSSNVTYWDARTRTRVTRKMYPVGDDLVSRAILNGQMYYQPYELRYIQMEPTR